MTFREKLVALRARDHLTQTALARAVGVTRQSVYMWEKGQSYPEAQALLALRRLFGVTIDTLLDDGLPLPDGVTPKATEKRQTPVLQTEPQKAEEPKESGEKAHLPGENAKTPSKNVEKIIPRPLLSEEEPEQSTPLRVKVEPSRERKSGSILDLLGAFWKRKK